MRTVGADSRRLAQDFEAGQFLVRCFAHGKLGNRRSRGRFGLDGLQEHLQVALLRLGMDLHARRAVEHPAGHAVAVRQPIHERAETDALNDAAN